MVASQIAFRFTHGAKPSIQSVRIFGSLLDCLRIDQVRRVTSRLPVNNQNRDARSATCIVLLSGALDLSCSLLRREFRHLGQRIVGA